MLLEFDWCENEVEQEEQRERQRERERKRRRTAAVPPPWALPRRRCFILVVVFEFGVFLCLWICILGFGSLEVGSCFDPWRWDIERP